MDIGAIFLLDDFLRNVRFFFPFISRTLPCYFPIGIFKNIFALCFACLIVCFVVLLCVFSVICRFFFFRCFAGSGILFDLSWMKVYFNAWKLGRCISVPHFSLICLCLFIKTTNLDYGCACMHPQFRLMHRRISLLLLHASAVPAVFKMFFSPSGPTLPSQLLPYMTCSDFSAGENRKRPYGGCLFQAPFLLVYILPAL